MPIDIDLLKKALGLDKNMRLSVRNVSNGYNVRFLHTYQIDSASYPMGVCAKCHKMTAVHNHHIVPRSAGGGNDKDNILNLCWDDHVGDNGLHLGKWSILDVVEEDKLFELKKRYGII